MLEIITAGGWLMLPLVICSVLATAVGVERLWSLRRHRVIPTDVPALARRALNEAPASPQQLRNLGTSPVARVLATVLRHRGESRESLRAAAEQTGSHVAHELRRFLNLLGTIATITPLIGLLGTVVGMISVFTRITSAGVGNPTELAGGISQALVTTAAGLAVAIPALLMHRYFKGKTESLLVELESESMQLIEAMNSNGEVDVAGAAGLDAVHFQTAGSIKSAHARAEQPA